MKCPRCGEVIHGVEHVTGQAFADFICAACEDEEDAELPEELEECTCARARTERADVVGFPCDACGRIVR